MVTDSGDGYCWGQNYAGQTEVPSDWTIGWLWTGIPDPRPRGRYARGLSHPAEHAAAISYVREIQTSQQFHGYASENGQAVDVQGYIRLCYDDHLTVVLRDP